MKKNNDPLVVVLAGATGGIGSEIAAQLIQAGHIVHAVGSSLESFSVLKRSYRGNEKQLSLYAADLSQEPECRRLSNEILSIAKSIDWFIYAAGSIDPHENSTPVTKESIETTFSVNVTAPILLQSLFSRHMNTDGGSIFIASTAGLWGNAQFPLYSASKAALISFARCTALQWEDTGLSSLAVCPGPTNTAMRSLVANDAHTKQSPAVVATVVVSIVSGISTYTNGDIIVVRDEKNSLFQ